MTGDARKHRDTREREAIETALGETRASWTTCSGWLAGSVSAMEGERRTEAYAIPAVWRDLLAIPARWERTRPNGRRRRSCSPS